MREKSVFHTGQEDNGEFQALGRVERHERDDAHPLGLCDGGGCVLGGSFGSVRDLVGVGYEGDLLQEFTQ
ncbi:hypothetical protein AHiyo8_22290 [Arthrobacter sp. Hiyo8]|nr:hypothetical protein AHiyo8_22290 [Arthrobacter sp. Hiyo8]